jgi:antitoxin FitA
MGFGDRSIRVLGTPHNFTIQGIPAPLYDRLKSAAARNRRSINGEVIARLEGSLGTAPEDADALLARARTVRETAPLPMTDSTDPGRTRSSLRRAAAAPGR